MMVRKSRFIQSPSSSPNLWCMTEYLAKKLLRKSSSYRSVVTYPLINVSRPVMVTSFPCSHLYLLCPVMPLSCSHQVLYHVLRSYNTAIALCESETTGLWSSDKIDLWYASDCTMTHIFVRPTIFYCLGMREEEVHRADLQSRWPHAATQRRRH